MIVGHGEAEDGSRLLFIGLSKENLRLLALKNPISRDITHALGIPVHLLLVTGDSEDSIMQEMRAMLEGKG